MAKLINVQDSTRGITERRYRVKYMVKTRLWTKKWKATHKGRMRSYIRMWFSRQK